MLGEYVASIIKGMHGVPRVYVNSTELAGELKRHGVEAEEAGTEEMKRMLVQRRGILVFYGKNVFGDRRAEIFVFKRPKRGKWIRHGSPFKPIYQHGVTEVDGEVKPSTPIVKYLDSTLVAYGSEEAIKRLLVPRGFRSDGGRYVLPVAEAAAQGSLRALIDILREEGVFLDLSPQAYDKLLNDFEKSKSAVSRLSPEERQSRLYGPELDTVASVVIAEVEGVGLPVDAPPQLEDKLVAAGVKLRLGEREYVEVGVNPNVFGDVDIRLVAVTRADLSRRGWTRFDGVWVKRITIVDGRRVDSRGEMRLSEVDGEPALLLEEEEPSFAGEHGFTPLEGGRSYLPLREVGDLNSLIDAARRGGIYVDMNADEYRVAYRIVGVYNALKEIRDFLESRGLPVSDVAINLDTGYAEVSLSRRVSPQVFATLTGVTAETEDGIVYQAPAAAFRGAAKRDNRIALFV